LFACGLIRSGESQFQREGGSPGSDCGWMSTRSPVRRSKRTRPACWYCEYTMLGSVGSTAGSKPSPPSVTNQSALVIPCSVRVRDGPPRVMLSCVPP
jgi:hypothetical protein